MLGRVRPQGPNRQALLGAVPILALMMLAGCSGDGGDSSQSHSTARSSQPDANPLAGRAIYVDPASPPVRQALTWSRQGRAGDAKDMRSLASRPTATWIADGPDVAGWVRSLVEPARQTGKTRLLVAYDIPGRDCGSYSAGGAPSAACLPRLGSGIRARARRGKRRRHPRARCDPAGRRGLPLADRAQTALPASALRGPPALRASRHQRLPGRGKRRLDPSSVSAGGAATPGGHRRGSRLRSQRQQLLPDERERPLRAGALASLRRRPFRDRHGSQRQRVGGRREERLVQSARAGPGPGPDYRHRPGRCRRLPLGQGAGYE